MHFKRCLGTRAQLFRRLLRVDGAEARIDLAGLLPTQNLQQAYKLSGTVCFGAEKSEFDDLLFAEVSPKLIVDVV